MGNSLRSTFGNLCGAEASKESHHNEDQRPVAKPKESAPKPEKKKKKKKSKNKKKNANGMLEKIEEGGENKDGEIEEKKPSDETVVAANDGKNNQEKNEEHCPAQPNSTEVIPPEAENTITNLTLKEQASNSEIISADSSDYLNNEEGESQDDEIEDEEESSQYEKSAEHIPQSPSHELGKSADSVDGADSRDGGRKSESDSQISGLASTGSSVEQNLPVYLTVCSVVPEELSINYADKIFQGCADQFQIFVDKNHEFKVAVNDFKEVISPHDDHLELEYHLDKYKQLQEDRSDDVEEVDMSDVNVSLQYVRAQGQELIATITNIRPRVKKHIDEAANVDVIEYVKGKMVEGVQLGITSKFSAPGKYRRNMKQLKRALSALDAVEAEVKEILENSYVNVDDGGNDQQQIQPMEDDESAIVPIMKSDDNTDDDIFKKLDRMDQEEEEKKEIPKEVLSDKKVDGSKTYERKLMNPENKDKPVTLLEQSGEIDRSTSPETLTYVIQNVPESSGVEHSNKQETSTPIKTPVFPMDPPSKSPVQQYIVEEEEHNTLDFGKYVLVDPNTGDIQVMRNRSRSLDSLVSMQSNRSSISRFGSFEFVTDFEIKIAEKNQQVR